MGRMSPFPVATYRAHLHHDFFICRVKEKLQEKHKTKRLNVWRCLPPPGSLPVLYNLHFHWAPIGIGIGELAVLLHRSHHVVVASSCPIKEHFVFCKSIHKMQSIQWIDQGEKGQTACVQEIHYFSVRVPEAKTIPSVLKKLSWQTPPDI